MSKVIQLSPNNTKSILTNTAHANTQSEQTERSQSSTPPLYIPLGVDKDNTSWLISVKSNKLCQFNATTIHSEPHLKTALGAGPVQRYCQTKNLLKRNLNIDCRQLGDEIIDATHEKGIFDPSSQIRVKGVYLPTPSCHGDYAIVNEGNGRVYASPSMTQLQPFCDGFVYTDDGFNQFDSDTKVGTAKDLKDIKKIFGNFTFDHPFEHMAILGTAIAVIHPTLLSIRPIWTVSAEAGSGKTSLLQSLQALWSVKKSAMFTTEQNAAQLTSTLKELNPTSVLFDECESESYRRYIFNLVEAMARAGYSSRENDSVIRAYQNKHTNIKFQVTTVFSGIQLPLLGEATLSRCLPFRLKTAPAGTKRPSIEDSLKKLEDIGPRIAKLIALKANVLLDLLQVSIKFLSTKLPDRKRDKYSVMCAGVLFYDLMTQCKQSQKKTLHDCFEFIKVLESRNVDETPDDLVLQTLRNSEVSFGSQALSFQDLCIQVAKLDNAVRLEDINANVGVHGIEFISTGSSLQVYVATSKLAVWLIGGFSKAKISPSTWRPVLRRVAVDYDIAWRYSGLLKPQKSVRMDVKLVINKV